MPAQCGFVCTLINALETQNAVQKTLQPPVIRGVWGGARHQQVNPDFRWGLTLEKLDKLTFLRVKSFHPKHRSVNKCQLG